jgi:hypothetical protein
MARHKNPSYLQMAQIDADETRSKSAYIGEICGGTCGFACQVHDFDFLKKDGGKE